MRVARIGADGSGVHGGVSVALDLAVVARLVVVGTVVGMMVAARPAAMRAGAGEAAERLEAAD